jgi:hypothetical protein
MLKREKNVAKILNVTQNVVKMIYVLKENNVNKGVLT